MNLRQTFCCAVAITTMLTGCQTTTPPQAAEPSAPGETARWPNKLENFKFRWSAGSGIDLLNGETVPLRAYLESWIVISYTESVDDAYPGYAQATPNYVKPWTPEWLALPQSRQMTHAFIGGDAKNNEHIVGNEFLHVLRIEPVDSGFRAIVCDNTFGVYRQTADVGTFTPMRMNLAQSPAAADSYNMQVWRIEFTDRRPGGGPGTAESPTAPQEGPRPSPAADVFGPWFTTGMQGAGFWYDTDNPGVQANTPAEESNRVAARSAEDELRKQCFDHFRLDPTQRFAAASTVVQQQPPVEVASPGWPEGPSS